MGNTFLESRPMLYGKTNNFSAQENNYFGRVNDILKQNYENNLYSDENLKISLEQKSFESSQFIPVKIEDITWLDCIFRHLRAVMSKYTNVLWARELYNVLSKEIFLSENKYTSNFFYNEYYIRTCPLIINEKYNDYNNDIINLNSQSSKAMNDISQDNAYNELDITDNLGGSYIEINRENLEPNDPTLQYKMKRKNLKKYIKVFKEHIDKNPQHPITHVIILFVKYFCKYINKNIESINNKLKNQLLAGDIFEQTIKDFDEEITSCLREFIITMHTSLKLFYSTSINYSYFDEEKDDLINLITSLFFSTGNLYESIYNLYSMSYSSEFEALQEKLNDLKNIKPKEMGIQIKYCLDEDTLELQRNILKEKQNEKDQKGQKEKNLEEKKMSKENDLFQIKEAEEMEDDNEKNNSNDNIIKTNKNIDIINENNIIEDIKINNKNEDEDDIYLLEKVNEESIDAKDALSVGFTHLRNTVNCFNNKKYLFPKISKNLRDTLALNDKYIIEAKNSGKLPVPYYSAINLLKNVKNYRTPFEKIVILAALNDQITESVTTFWNSMKNYIKNSYLTIEADEMMTIFAFITIKAQRPEMFIDSKIITNFTTPSTRSFNISYNLTLLEAAIETINNMKNVKEIGDRNKQLKNVRKSIAVISTQRLSRLSRLSSKSNHGFL